MNSEEEAYFFNFVQSLQGLSPIRFAVIAFNVLGNFGDNSIARNTGPNENSNSPVKNRHFALKLTIATQ